MVDFNQDFIAPGSSNPLRLRESGNGVVFHLSGTGTFTAVVERSTRDPQRSAGNWARAEDDDWAGNLSTGVAPRVYNEPARGWWRLRVTALSGTIQLNIMGERA